MPVSVPTADEFAAGLARLDDFERRLRIVEDRAPDPLPNPDPEPTGMWLSGGSPNINKAEATAQFGAWCGQVKKVANCYPTRDNWSTLVSATSGQPALWAKSDVTPIVQLPFFPQGAYTYAEAAAEKYVPQWKQFATAWKGRKKLICPGWEANHSGTSMHYWCGPGGGPQRYTKYDLYTKTFDLFAKVVHDIDSDAEIGWIMNGHDSPGFVAEKYPANDPRNILPNPEHLAFLGVDYYDQYPPSFGGTNTSGKRKDFDTESREVNGVRWYADLAFSLGVQFAVPEWAVVSGDDNRGGDNPTFVTNMNKVFTEAWNRKLPDGRRLMKVESYYDDAAQRMNISAGQNPKAAAAYLAAYRGA